MPGTRKWYRPLINSAVLVTVVVLIGAAGASYRQSVKRLHQETVNQNLSAVQVCASDIDKWMMDKTLVVKILANTVTTLSLPQSQLAPLVRAGSLDPSIMTIKTYFEAGYGAGSRKGRATQVDMRTRPWYRSAAETGETSYTAPYHALSGDSLVVSISQPIFDDAGKFLGVMAADVQVETLDRLLHNMRINHGATAYLLDMNGASLLQDDDPLPKELVSRLLKDAKSNPVGAYYDSDLKSDISFATIPTPGWILVAESPFNSTLGPMAVLRENSLVMLLIALAIVVLTARMLSDRNDLRFDRLRERTANSVVTVNHEVAAADSSVDGLEAIVDRMVANLNAFPEVLNLVLGLKDEYTATHSQSVEKYSLAIADQLGLDEHSRQVLRCAAILHDIGKVGVPDNVLRKPGNLSPDEWDAVRRHPGVGASVAQQADFSSEIVSIIRSHHERFDGRGYPDGLKGEQIPMLARIIAVADSFDAMTTVRPYRSPLAPRQAIEELLRCSGTQFDPQVALTFSQLFPEEPALEKTALDETESA